MRRSVAFLLVLMTMGCGEGGDTLSPEPQDELPLPTAAERVAAGWEEFENGEFATALSRFEDAAGIDPGYAEAHSGSGWAHMRLGELTRAADAFERAIPLDLDSVDPQAGKAAIYRDLEPVDWQATLDAARHTLDSEPRYIFPHDATFDWRDLRLILAHAAFGLGDYELAAVQVDSLGGTAPSPDATDFIGNLLAEMQRLGAGIAER